MQPPTFHSLYEAYANDIFRFARFLTRSDDAAADIASDTFLRAWAGRDTIRATTARAYLFTVARNLCRDRARSVRQWPEAPMPDRAVGPAAEARVELRRTLDAAATLPDAYREPLMLAASGVGLPGRVAGPRFAGSRIDSRSIETAGWKSHTRLVASSFTGLLRADSTKREPARREPATSTAPRET
jgi:RNA polymerase sigma-70 factor (ECF subfamily)